MPVYYHSMFEQIELDTQVKILASRHYVPLPMQERNSQGPYHKGLMSDASHDWFSLWTLPPPIEGLGEAELPVLGGDVSFTSIKLDGIRWGNRLLRGNLSLFSNLYSQYASQQNGLLSPVIQL